MVRQSQYGGVWSFVTASLGSEAVHIVRGVTAPVGRALSITLADKTLAAERTSKPRGLRKSFAQELPGNSERALKNRNAPIQFTCLGHEIMGKFLFQLSMKRNKSCVS